MAKAPPLTPQDDDFPRWYQDVVAKAELAENGPVRGTMVIRPYGFSLWERMQAEVDERIKVLGVDNAYFPLFIPDSYFRREAEHVEGFSPELAMVTHGGGKELDEPVAVRPTSETVMGEYFAKWIQSYRDLPLLVNQWGNVVRWELRPRLFLRTSEFLWQEGHTCHADADDARAFAIRVLREVYEDFMVNVLAIPVQVGDKTGAERFAGAINTMTCEALMRDGKALQMGTSHELGQNFARAFDIDFLSSEGDQELVWQTSWGSSTRMVGGLIMTHGDDHGLRVPPRLAPIQAVVVVVRDDADTRQRAAALADELRGRGVRVRLDDRVDTSFGRRATDWELKGVPVRLELGPRDLESGVVTVARRIGGDGGGGKEAVPLDGAAEHVEAVLEASQQALLDEATVRRDAATEEVSTLDEAIEAAGAGFARVPWSAVGPQGEARAADQGVTVRCLQAPDGGLPAPDGADTVAYLARSY